MLGRMRLNVNNEIGRLKSVLVHLPGKEIDVMVPSMMEQLLFDDILFGQLAREEHRRFQQIMWFVADEVLDLQDLLEEVFDDAELKAEVVRDFSKRTRLSKSFAEFLTSKHPAQLAEVLVAGIVGEEGNRKEPLFDLAPVPNLFFARDPQIVIGNGVAVCSMATRARQRESLLSSYIFRFHKAFRGQDLFWLDPWHPAPSTSSAAKAKRKPPTLEGGDVLVARRDVLLVGLSERTNRAGIEQLAQALKTSDSPVKTILVVELPKRRSFMHLDTVFTLTNRNECLVYPPVILERGRDEAKVYLMDLTRRSLTYSPQKSLLSSLKKKKMDLEPISCGGQKFIEQQREQWTDGANAFVLAPGVILLYERNVGTAAELAQHGYHIVYEDDLLLGRTELETWTDKKYAIQIQGHELSRARGGPRCMTMPLAREEV